MLFYGRMVKFAELSHFLAAFGTSQKMLLAQKFEPLDQTTQNFECTKENIFLTSGKKDDSMQHHKGYEKWQKHGAHFTPNGLYSTCLRYAFSIGTLVWKVSQILSLVSMEIQSWPLFLRGYGDIISQQIGGTNYS